MSTNERGLVIRDLGASFDDALILDGVELALPRRGIAVVMGPAGGGKSTLARTLAGVNDALPSFRYWGRVLYDQSERDISELPEDQRPILVRQNAGFYLATARENLAAWLPNRAALSLRDQTLFFQAHLDACETPELSHWLTRNVLDLPVVEQRRLSIVRSVLRKPRTLLVDEPTAGLSAADADKVIGLLGVVARKCSVLLITHHQGHARKTGGIVHLLAGGRIVERAPVTEFLDRPRTSVAKRFVETGRCEVPPPAPGGSRLDPRRSTMPASPAAKGSAVTGSAVGGARGPQGFYWVVPGRLGGMPRPGVTRELQHDLHGLQRLRVRLLVTLEEQETVPQLALARIGIRRLHFPVPDMGAPSIERAAVLCTHVDQAIAAGEVVVMHCRAGLGRTGTLLCCQLIWRGATACSALEQVRGISPRCVESPAQLRLLSDFQDYVASRQRVRDVERRR